METPKPINIHCKKYLEEKNEEIRKMIAKTQQGHDAGDEDPNAWKEQTNG